MLDGLGRVPGKSRGGPGGPGKAIFTGCCRISSRTENVQKAYVLLWFYTFLHTRGKQIVTIFMISDSFHADNLQNAVGSVGELAIELNFGPFDVS